MTILASDRLESALARINDPAGEGSRTFLTVYSEAARKAARAADRRSHEGKSLGPLDGVIVSIKDLFDVAGEPTRAGSTILIDAPPASVDAAIVTRLRDAGAVIVGKTNMSEFAFTGVGVNPHYGTPGNPADRTRVPGGSSSGAPVSVADRMCDIAIGTDTGGSTRIPAALCGMVGFKPSKSRVPTDGAFPLSPTLDSVGPIARSVADCAIADCILAGERSFELEPISIGGLRLRIPQGLPMRDLDEIVGLQFEAAIASLEKAGVNLTDAQFSLFDGMSRINRIGTIASVEAYQFHRQWLQTHGDQYDPRVRERIEMGSAASTGDYGRMLSERTKLARAMDVQLADVDALVLPTTPIVAPTIEEVSTGEGFREKNRLLLRNTAIVNFFDLCAISLPLGAAGALPSGLMLVARHGHDRRLFGIAEAVERALLN